MSYIIILFKAKENAFYKILFHICTNIPLFYIHKSIRIIRHVKTKKNNDTKKTPIKLQLYYFPQPLIHIHKNLCVFFVYTFIILYEFSLYRMTISIYIFIYYIKCFIVCIKSVVYFFFQSI